MSNLNCLIKKFLFWLNLDLEAWENCEDDVIIISTFATDIINIVFQWSKIFIETSSIVIDDDFKNARLNERELILFNNAFENNIHKIYILVNAADFFNMPMLPDKLAIYLAKNMTTINGLK